MLSESDVTTCMHMRDARSGCARSVQESILQPLRFLILFSSTYWILDHNHLLCLPKSTQMAAVPFGFSFGDFIAAIEVIHKVSQALRRSSGARSHFHQAVADLECFEDVLRRVEALSPTTASPDAVEAIRLCAFKCHPPLNHFLQRIRFYEKHMDQPTDSKTQILKCVTGSFWKAKWAIKVEQEVSKLKADIGPLLEAISVLLQIESRQQSAATHDAVEGLVNDVTSGFDKIMLAVQEHALATRRIDLRTIDVHLNTQNVVQQLPQLPTSTQLDGLLFMAKSVSARVGSTATKDQIEQLTSLLQASSATRLAITLFPGRGETQTLQMGEKIKDVHTILRATEITRHSYPHPITTSAAHLSAPTPPPCGKPSDLPSHPLDQSKSANIRTHYRAQSQLLLSSICRLLVSAVMALVLVSPNIRSQLRTFMTLLKSPRLLSSNSITVIDALNRTKMLPYEYFSNWNLVQPWLESTFKGLPGESRVKRGEFALFTQLGKRTGPEIPLDRWESAVFPGDQVVMSVLAFEMEIDECQRCKAVLPLPSISAGGIKWLVRRPLAQWRT